MENQSIKVLIVDDEIINLKILEAMLKGDGYRILTATSGIEGREIANRELPDIILLDIMMTGEDGFTTCEKLKHNAKTANIPIIFISALDDAASKVRGLSIGGWDYITKPFHKEEVMVRVKNYLKLSLSFKMIIESQANKLQQLRDAQQAILIDPSELPEANFSACYVPKLEAGGDFYDVYEISQYIHDYFVSDISGHDIGASFATSALKALVQQNSSLLFTPVETMQIINKVLCSIFKSGQHMTAVYMRIDREKNNLTIVNAAHCRILILPKRGAQYSIGSTCGVIGAFEDSIFESTIISVSPGDRIFLYSDGLVERFEQTKQTRNDGIDLLLSSIKRFPDSDIQDLAKKIVDDIYPEKNIAEDDLLLLAVEI